MQPIVFNPETYKRTFAEQNLYERLPALVAENATAIKSYLGDPCADDTVVCTMEKFSPGETVLASASPEVQACARLALGEEAYQALYIGERPPARREIRRVNACIRQIRREERASNPGIASDLVPVLHNLTAEQWEGLTRILLPANSLRQMTESGLDQAFAYLNSETASARISLAPLRSRLTGPAGDTLIRFLLEAQPACTEGQLAQINAGNFENGGATAIYCAVPEEALPLVIPSMRHRLEMVASELPDEIILSESAPVTPVGISVFTKNPLFAIRTIRKWIPFSPIVPLALLLFLTLFVVRSFKSLLRWWGSLALVAGLLALVLGIFARPLLEWIWLNRLSAGPPVVFSEGLVETGYAVIVSLIEELGKWLAIESGALVVLGLIALIFSNAKRKPDTTARSFIPPELAPLLEPPQQTPAPTRNETGYS
jgi:hypothetical protein